jgi:hypothetical protein
MNKERNTGAGWTVYQSESHGRENCGRWMEATDAEAAVVAALKAVKTVIEHASQNSTSLDNISVIEGINTKADGMGTSLPTIDKIRESSGWRFWATGRVPGHAVLAPIIQSCCYCFPYVHGRLKITRATATSQRHHNFTSAKCQRFDVNDR